MPTPDVDPTLTPRSKLHVLLLTGGHDFDHAAFLHMFAAEPDIVLTHVEHSGPGASGWDAADLERCDAVLLYDLQRELTDGQRARLLSLFARGVGLVVTHHALVSFPRWPEYERIVGGRYVEAAPGSAADALASSYQLDVEVPVQIVDPEHPVMRGLDDFVLRDEIYVRFRVGQEVTPLLRTSHPASGNPIAWERREQRSRVVYIQPGHGPSTYQSPQYRRLLGNALRYVAGG